MKSNLLQAINELGKRENARFASLTYTNKEGEKAKHTILLGASYDEAKMKDLQRLLCLAPRLSGIKKVACEELIFSYKEKWEKLAEIENFKIYISLLTDAKEIEQAQTKLQAMQKASVFNSNYTCKDTYNQTSIKGVKEHKESGDLYLMGYSVQKVVLVPVEYPKVKSSPKTIAKNELRQLGRLGKIRQFTITKDQIESMRINGKTLEFI